MSRRAAKISVIVFGAAFVVSGCLRLSGIFFDETLGRSRGFLDQLAKNSLIAYGEATPHRGTDQCSSDGLRWALDGQIVDAVAEAAKEHSLDRDLVYAVIHAESRFNPNAVSLRGAKGLMQLMPSTALSLGVKNPYSIKENVSAGSRYLSSLLDKYDGDIELALAAYNAGPANVSRFNKTVPPFRATRAYVKQVVCNYKKLRARSVNA